MKNLENFGVQEMNDTELSKTNGGGLLGLLGKLVVGALVSELIFDGIAQCRQDFLDGFNETY